MVVSQLMNALAYGALLTMLSSGLALIYGLRGVMNFAHGSLYLLAAYTSTTVVAYTSFWVALVVVPVVFGIVAGVVMEYGLLRPLAAKPPLVTALVLFGVALVLENLQVLLFGAEQRLVPNPIEATVDLGGAEYPLYRIFLIAVGVGSVLVLVGWLRFTRSGMHVRAVSADPQTARMVGVNTNRLGTVVVCLSTAFAALAGVLAGPYLAVDPGMGHSILVICLIIVVLGGVGSIGGAIVAALLVGFVQVIGNITIPDVAAVLPYALLIAVMVWRPQGLGRGRVAH
jgi:branched-chain amino acid transport system permease protein